MNAHRPRPALFLALGACLFLAGAARGEDRVDDREHDGAAGRPALEGTRAERTEAADRAHEALVRGLDYLARRQAETVDGSFPKGDEEFYAPVGVTALGALAFMAGGSSPGRGPHGRSVDAALAYLLSKANLRASSPTYGWVSAAGDKLSRAHGHGFATLAFAQAYGMTPRSEELRGALIAAVQIIEASQGAEGGWYYDPLPSAQHEGSVTIAYVQALRAAHNAGIQVTEAVIHRAEDYVVRLQNENGLFRYGLNEQRASVALTAAAIGTLNAAGRYDTRIVQDGIDAIWKELAAGGEAQGSFPYYERLYLAQALWQLADTRQFDRWFGEERARLLREQGADGSWRDGRHGDCYATAVNCLVLALPDGLLPIFQR